LLQALFVPLPEQAEIERIFALEAWPDLEGQPAIAVANRIGRPRGGNQRASTLPFREAIQVALWDLAAKEAGLPLHRMLGSRRERVKAYASGLDFHLTDDAFEGLFSHAAELGYRAFKIKVGHPDFGRDLDRLRLLKGCVPLGSEIMIDANEAWSAKEALVRMEAIRREGHDLLWVEDPILRDDFPGLRMLRNAAPWTQINAGEYLDLHGKRLLLQAEGADILNVHGQVSDVMRIGWLAADMGVPVSLGNTFLEVGVHMAVALPEVEWLEYSFQNFDHLVEQPIEIRDGYAYAPDRPGHGLVLSGTARRDWARPALLDPAALGAAPVNPRVRQD
jgi:L-alanine-DL-glutamate epimerase-like enolase superfamily enzyme